MSSPSAQPECIMPECQNKPARRGLCWTHYEHLNEHASIAVQRVVEEHERQADLAAEFDWDYLTEDQRSAIERGVRDAYWENGRLQEYDLENMLQDAWIWAASHKAEVQRIETFTLLRERTRSRAVESNRAGWASEASMDYLEDILADRED